MAFIRHFFWLFMILCVAGVVSLWQLALLHPDAALLIGYLVGAIFVIMHWRLVLMVAGVAFIVYIGFHL